MNDIDILDSFIKSPGGVEKQKKKCGKSNCRCAKGTHLHKAYCYRFWKFENGSYTRKRVYLDKNMFIRIEKAINRYKTRHPNTVHEYYLNRQGFLEFYENGIKPDYAVIDRMAIPMSRFLR